MEARMLAYPAFEFEYHRGFALATKVMAYEGVGHTTEFIPLKNNHLHLRPGIIRKSHHHD